MRPTPIPAATVVLVRDGDDGLEVLMLRRSSAGQFGGMWVFPGGKVDDADMQGDDELAGARRAAVREAAEEAAVPLDEADLVVHSHWLAPDIRPKRFATWFFLAGVAPGEVVVDGYEIEDHEWATPSAVLAKREAGEVELVPPTFVTLLWLTEFASAADALAAARARVEPEYFATKIAQAPDGSLMSMWAGDAAYDSGDTAAPGDRHRLVMNANAWVYEKSITSQPR